MSHSKELREEESKSEHGILPYKAGGFWTAQSHTRPTEENYNDNFRIKEATNHH